MLESRYFQQVWLLTFLEAKSLSQDSLLWPLMVKLSWCRCMKEILRQEARKNRPRPGLLMQKRWKFPLPDLPMLKSSMDPLRRALITTYPLLCQPLKGPAPFRCHGIGTSAFRGQTIPKPHQLVTCPSEERRSLILYFRLTEKLEQTQLFLGESLLFRQSLETTMSNRQHWCL